MTDRCRALEALLFMTAEPLSKRELRQHLNCSVDELKQAAEELHESVREHGIALVISDTHLQLVAKRVDAPAEERFVAERARRLSAAAAETLSLVAYRGPISRGDIEAIRGVDSRRILQYLGKRGLVIKATHSSSDPTYTVSSEFLISLGYSRPEELPEFAFLASNEKIDEWLARSESDRDDGL